MAEYKPRVIALTKPPGQSFGFFLRVEQGEDGHLIRNLEMGGPAELSGLRDGDRVLRVNGNYVDTLTHSQVVGMVKDSGVSVTFHVLDADLYKKAKADGVDLSNPQPRPAPNQNQSQPVMNGMAGQAPKPKLCYMEKTSAGYGFSLRSARAEPGIFMTDITPGGVADKAGITVGDRLVEVNGENVESATHDAVVEKVKMAGSNIMVLLVDEDTDRYYKNKRIAIGAGLATIKHLPLKPRIADLTKGLDGYGYYLRVEPKLTGHYIKNIDKGSSAEKGGLKEMDRLVAVEGQEVDSCSHEQVVDMIKECGNKSCLLVVDAETDKMYKLGGVSPLLFWEESKESLLPPSYPDAITMPTPARASSPAPSDVTPPVTEELELKPRLCKMEKTSAGYGFHLNGIQGVGGQYIKQVVPGGAADRAGLEDEDIVIEVDGVNVERSSHEEVVELIKQSGSVLQLLVADKKTYNQLKARDLTASSQLPAPVSAAPLALAASAPSSTSSTPPPSPSQAASSQVPAPVSAAPLALAASAPSSTSSTPPPSPSPVASSQLPAPVSAAPLAPAASTPSSTSSTPPPSPSQAASSQLPAPVSATPAAPAASTPSSTSSTPPPSPSPVASSQLPAPVSAAPAAPAASTPSSTSTTPPPSPSPDTREVKEEAKAAPPDTPPVQTRERTASVSSSSSSGSMDVRL